MALPGLKYVVLDANEVREAGTVAALIDEYRKSGQRIVLAWVHAFEHSKGSADWWDKAHAYLSSEPEAVIYAMPSSYLIALERENRAPHTELSEIEDNANSGILRRLIADPRRTTDISAMRATVEQRFRELNRTGWVDLLDNGVRIDDADLRRMRRGLQDDDREPIRAAVVEWCKEGKLQQTLAGLIDDREEAAQLMQFPSMSALTIVAYFYVGVRRQVQTPRRESEDNIACDIEAALVALYGRRLVTRDGFAQELDQDLRLIANAVWP
jgi:hypothetical protein